MASGVMADFARMPTGRKVFVFVVIGLALFGLYYRFVLKSLKEDLDEADEQHETLVGQNASKDRELKDYEELRPTMAKLQEQIDRNQAALPTEAEVPAFFETLQRKIRQSGVSLAKWKQMPEEPIESFVKVPVDIEINGTFMQLKRFFASLIQKDIAEATDERERIVSIESLSLGQPQFRDRSITLSAKFSAVTFRQDNKPAASPAKPGDPTPAKAAPPPPAPSSAPAAPPLPPSASPAGAKARVDDAMKKGGENRVNDSDTPAAGSARLKGGL